MIKIGLTGGIGTGKSFILDIFKKEGFFTLKADVLAKSLYYNNKKLRELLISAFGDDFFVSQKEINKKKLEYILYYDKEKRLEFNNIFYPIFKEYQKDYFNKISSKYKIIIYEAALLFEVGTYKLFDKIILVNCSIEKQIERIKKRGLKEEKILKIIDSQYPFSKTKKYADFIINTNKTKLETINQTKDIINKLKRYN